jgi:thiosulfate/3-mercaptopyruvate sulfurtransferase
MSFGYAIRLLILLSIVIVSLAAFPQSPANPWIDSQTVQPAALAKELADAKTAPTVLFVGFGRLFTSGHVKGAQFHGSGGSPDGLAQIKAWVASLPHNTNLVIYCGCCPMERCPNVRPAFTALRDMGFTNVRVLILPTDFAKDWADQGYPYDKGQ